MRWAPAEREKRVVFVRHQPGTSRLTNADAREVSRNWRFSCTALRSVSIPRREVRAGATRSFYELVHANGIPASRSGDPDFPRDVEFRTANRHRKVLSGAFQEGETAFGVPIINGQHPHDFFMELSASYQLRLGERTVLNLYGGPRGEPALGPPSYPHRVSVNRGSDCGIGPSPAGFDPYRK